MNLNYTFNTLKSNWNVLLFAASTIMLISACSTKENNSETDFDQEKIETYASEYARWIQSDTIDEIERERRVLEAHWRADQLECEISPKAAELFISSLSEQL